MPSPAVFLLLLLAGAVLVAVGKPPLPPSGWSWPTPTKDWEGPRWAAEAERQAT